MQTATIYAGNKSAWYKIARYQIPAARAALNDPEYKKALVKAGFDESIEIRAINDQTGEQIA